MRTTIYTHHKYGSKFTVTELAEGESKGWAGDSYVSNGPSIVIVHEQGGTWEWSEYDNPSTKAQERIDTIRKHGWTAV